MKIRIIQAPIIGLAIEENRKWIQEALEESMENKPDVILLPELWNTGYMPDDLDKVTDLKEGEIQEQLSIFAKKNQVNLIGGSIATRISGQLKNRSYVYNRQGECIAHYDKVHLFSPSGEDKIFQAGDSLCKFSVDGISSALVNCNDLRFPEWIRLNAMKEVKILFVPSAWAFKRIEQMHFLSKTRAYENQFFVLVANATRAQGHKALSGGQSIGFGPNGQEIFALDTQAQIAEISLDLSAIDEYKEFLNLWKDRRYDLYKGLDEK